jgi:hypothetical protein
VSNWINSGGNGPHSCTDDNDRQNRNPEPERSRPAWRPKTPLKIGFAVLSLALASQLGEARDRGQYANANPELKAWFEGLKSGKGPCCSDADGTAISDVDWESSHGHYRVRLEGEWIDVPEEAVITEPNRIGRTMVWPLRGYLGVSIRCFMPGSMT